MRAEHAVLVTAAATTVLAAATNRDRVQRVAKPLMVPALAVRVLRARRRGQVGDVDAVLLATGLVAATIGDLFMLQPDDDRRIVRGASSFAVTQLAYSSVFYRHGARPTAPTAAPRLLAGTGLGVLLARKSPRVALQLSAYGATLSTMSALAAAPGLSHRSAAGGMLFAVSDGLIAVRRTLVHDPRARARTEAAILATYALAQALLVEGMLALSRTRSRTCS